MSFEVQHPRDGLKSLSHLKFLAPASDRPRKLIVTPGGHVGRLPLRLSTCPPGCAPVAAGVLHLVWQTATRNTDPVSVLAESRILLTEAESAPDGAWARADVGAAGEDGTNGAGSSRPEAWRGTRAKRREGQRSGWTRNSDGATIAVRFMQAGTVSTDFFRLPMTHVSQLLTTSEEDGFHRQPAAERAAVPLRIRLHSAARAMQSI